MIDTQLRARGIVNARVLDAMRTVPRHVFLDPSLHRRAYDDAALPTTDDQTISQPYMVAVMTQTLGVDPTHRVLEIGTGSGYQTMILARLAAEVFTIERYASLAHGARDRLDSFGVTNVHIHLGDGTLGWPDLAPFDRILVTAGAPKPPPALIDQLADPGRMVIPLGDRTYQTLVTLEKRRGKVHQTDGLGCHFVPLVGEQGWPGDED
ncbi:MAG: protein-L-isoaspartate(D-aspartate) O-methyltransferase [Planctomycetes bacterium]|nr:protein-L-isoaspartate(D-aspartate) O-methyltransferase [Planctomycetota bacterium]